ncbi:MAG: hypothetical protein SWE60_13125 [Thermodesulfobacteriota bacterium]|nr:hypothetical protein [Thermodesulfobacteriota bacterium]
MEKRQRRLKSNVTNVVVPEHPRDEREALVQEKYRASAVPVVISSAPWTKSAGLARKRGAYRRPTGEEDIDNGPCLIKEAMETLAFEHKIEVLRRLLGEQASLYEFVENWGEMKKLVSLFV